MIGVSEKLIMICMVNRFHTSMKPTDLMLDQLGIHVKHTWVNIKS